jgi:Fic family protein
MHHSKKYIWQSASWPKFSWDNGVLVKPIGECRRQQGVLLTKMGELGFDLQQEARAALLIKEALKTSEIEGMNLNPDAVRSSVVRRLGLSTAGLPMVQDQHADGVVEILLDASFHHDKPLTAQRLFGWHAALFPTGYSGIQKIRVAGWRDDKEGPIGREKVHYEAPPAESVPGEMALFLKWWKESQNEMDGLLRAAMAHLWFVAIHPFEDGNGRIARTLCEMALAHDEGTSTRYYSLSAQIMASQEGYYRVLEKVNKNMGDVTPWMIWFLSCLLEALSKSDGLLKNIVFKEKFWRHHAQTILTDRQCKVINRLLNAGPGGFEGGMTTRKYAGITHVSRATAQREIADLVEKNIMRPNQARGRSTSYDLNWAF